MDIREVFDGPRLLVSVSIGFASGVFAAITMNPSLSNISSESILTFAAAGYSGADFIEGLMSKQLVKISRKPETTAGAKIANTTDSPSTLADRQEVVSTTVTPNSYLG